MENQFGKISKLSLVASFKDDKTIVSDVSFTAPFKIARPFYEKKGVMSVMLLTASAGTMAGDTQEFDITVNSGANMEFISQAYEKIHRMLEGYASRKTHLKIAKDGILRYTPLPTIPFHDSDYRSEVKVELEDKTSKFIMSEVLTSGRVAYGESFLYKKFQNKVSIYEGGTLVYRDNTCYEPSKMDMTSLGMYEGFTHLGNIVICNYEISEDWIRDVRSMMDEDEALEGGVTRTSNGYVVVRVFGKRGDQITKFQEKILKEIETE